MYLEAVLQKIKTNPDLDFGKIFNSSFELFKNVWVQGFITLLLTTLTILPFYIIIYIPMIAAGITDPEMLQDEELPPMVMIGMCILFPFVILGVMTFTLALNAAFLKICHVKEINVPAAEDYFYFFKEGRLGKVFKVALITLGLSFLGMLACGIGLIYLAVPLSLLPAFLAFSNELSAMEMVKASFALGNKNWLVIFGLIILMSFIAQLGIFLCCIGVFFTAMLGKIPTYYIYKDGVGFPEIQVH